MNILLFSGGADSSLLFHTLVIEKVEFNCIFLDYCQEALENEQQAVTELCSKFFIPLEIVKLNIDTKYNDFYIAGRNLFLVGLAATRCREGDSIYIGVNKSDDADFPDCRAEFVKTLRQSLYLGYGIKLETPLISLTKKAILQKLRTVNYSNYFYCYTPKEGVPCGKCLSCSVYLEAV